MAIAVLGGMTLSLGGAAVARLDFGSIRDHQLASRSARLFGVEDALPQSSNTTVSVDRAESDPSTLATFSPGLHVGVVTASEAAGANVDMMALWPNASRPTYLIACNEGDAADPGLQRINIRTGAVATILRGTISCDPVQATAWGTIVFGEEEDDGRLYELLDPLHATGVRLDRETGRFTGGDGAEDFAVRPGLGRLAYEGLAVYPNGLVYYGDENRPFKGTGGGAYFKFVPTHPYHPRFGPISDASESPLAEGSVYGLRLGRRPGEPDYGQGTSYGVGRWIEIPDGSDPDLRAQGAALHLTGYYRPEDAAVDQRALDAHNVRLCANNTGNEAEDKLYGETICLNDGSLSRATDGISRPDVQLLIVGNPELAMMDNIAWQPGRGNWILHEDGDGPEEGRNNDLWDCLPDGADDDLLSDGCIRVATLNDLVGTEGDGAEWTGGIFDATGSRFFVSVQHNVTGHGVVLEVTGWR